MNINSALATKTDFFMDLVCITVYSLHTLWLKRSSSEWSFHREVIPLGINPPSGPPTAQPPLNRTPDPQGPPTAQPPGPLTPRDHLPTSSATRTPLTLCSRTLWIWGVGPLLMTVRALAWVTERTVAALSQGSPNTALRPPMDTSSSRSQWKPEPFTIFLSGLLTIRLQAGEEEEGEEERGEEEGEAEEEGGERMREEEEEGE